MPLRLRPLFCLLTSILLVAPAATQQVSYPPTRTMQQVDDYHGTRVADPYRWMEDDTAPEVKAWVEAQNTVTFGYLEAIPYRDRLRARLEELYNYPRIGAPSRTGPWYVFSRNDGLQNQSVLMIQRGLDGTAEVLIDPNTFSTDGTVRLGASELSRDGKYFAYGRSSGGSDWQEYYVMETATRKPLPDRLRWIKASGLSWQGEGFYYSRYPAPDDSARALSGRNEHQSVWYHRVGTPQSADQLVFADPAHPLRFHGASVTEDERFLVLSISDRSQAGNLGNALWIRDLSRHQTVFRPVVAQFRDSYSVLDAVNGRLLVRTNRNAPNYRIVSIDPDQPGEANWTEVVAERPEPIASASTVGGRLIVTYTKDVTHRVQVFGLDGTPEREIELPTLGRVGGFGGRAEDTETFYTFTSFTFPPTVYRYDIATGRATIYRETAVPFDPNAFEARQVFYPSKDGTRIPMFVVYRKGLELDGRRPTLLYAYGGFNIAQGPSFNPLTVALLEQGGVYALANIRGGSEYGEDWHRAGMLLNKQNVFDDFIAAAEWLQQNGYTSQARCALQGGSNGGLLVGAVMTQRPDLCGVALPAVGVMDMLRYHKFTIGWNWAAEYGSSEDPAHFENLLGYSPLHNLKDGTTYPATLVTTADHDDRVVPAHSFKFAARLQAAHTGTSPVLIRVETRSGHGAVSTAKRLEETADLYAFMWHNMGFTPSYGLIP